MIQGLVIAMQRSVATRDVGVARFGTRFNARVGTQMTPETIRAAPEDLAREAREARVLEAVGV